MSQNIRSHDNKILGNFRDQNHIGLKGLGRISVRSSKPEARCAVRRPTQIPLHCIRNPRTPWENPRSLFAVPISHRLSSQHFPTLLDSSISSESDIDDFKSGVDVHLKTEDLFNDLKLVEQLIPEKLIESRTEIAEKPYSPNRIVPDDKIKIKNASPENVTVKSVGNKVTWTSIVTRLNTADKDVLPKSVDEAPSKDTHTRKDNAEAKLKPSSLMLAAAGDQTIKSKHLSDSILNPEQNSEYPPIEQQLKAFYDKIGKVNYNETTSLQDQYGLKGLMGISSDEFKENPHGALLSVGFFCPKLIEGLDSPYGTMLHGFYNGPFRGPCETIEHSDSVEVTKLATILPMTFSNSDNKLQPVDEDFTNFILSNDTSKFCVFPNNADKDRNICIRE